jgi:hypothetical protein
MTIETRQSFSSVLCPLTTESEEIVDLASGEKKRLQEELPQYIDLDKICENKNGEEEKDLKMVDKVRENIAGRERRKEMEKEKRKQKLRKGYMHGSSSSSEGEVIIE